MKPMKYTGNQEIPPLSPIKANPPSTLPPVTQSPRRAHMPVTKYGYLTQSVDHDERWLYHNYKK